MMVLLSSLISAVTSFQFKTPNDRLEIGEVFGNVISALTKNHIPELESYQVQTDEGSTNVNQYIRFQGLNNVPRVTFTENEQDEVDDFLYFPSGGSSNDAFFDYEMEFEEGIISGISETSLSDYEGKKLRILNEEFEIVIAKKDGNSVELTIASGSVSDIISEGTSKMYTIGTTNYEVNVLTIDADKSVRLKVNGVELTKMNKGEIATLEGDAIIGVVNVLLSNTQAPDMVKLFVGAKVITFKDSDFTDNNFNQDVSINKNKLNDGYVKIAATSTPTELKITKLNYRLVAKIKIYLKQSQKLTDYLPNIKALLGNWDIRYASLESPSYNEIRLNPTANSEYTLVFKNKAGDTISAPFITNKNGTFKLGDEDQDLLIQEGSSSSFNIDKNDYFVLTSSNTKTGSTYILKYDSIDTVSNITYFTDLGTNSQKSAPLTMNQSDMYGEGTLNVGAMTAKVFVDDAANNPIAVDLNGAGGPDGATVVDIVTFGGGILDLTTLAGATYTINLKTEQSEFEENSSDENVQFIIESRSGNTIGIQNSFSGISTGTTTGHVLGLSNYGVEMDIIITTAATQAETLLFKYPTDQVFGSAYIDVGQSQSVAITSQQVQTSCINGILDGDETGIDCGGSCPSCQAATCDDGVQNQNETGVDCGGSCPQCASITQAPQQCPDGCLYTDENEDKCLPIGTRVGSLFCDKDKKIKAQKDLNAPCENSYECKINICENSKCGKHISILLIIVNIVILSGIGLLIYFIIRLFAK